MARQRLGAERDDLLAVRAVVERGNVLPDPVARHVEHLARHRAELDQRWQRVAL